MDSKPQKSDPITNKYFKPLESAEKVSGGLFICSVVLSLATLSIPQDTYPALHSIVQITFILSVILFAVNETSIKLYFFPRAQSKRYQDFLAHVYEDKIAPLQTENYYTTNATDRKVRMAYQLLENSHYSTDTVTQMIKRERIKIVGYLIIWLLIILHRDTNLELITIVAQVLFSEQIISRWLRMEWLRFQFEAVFESVYRVIKSNCDIELLTLELLGRYETVKANAGITLSSKIFKKREETTDREWKSIKATLNI